MPTQLGHYVRNRSPDRSPIIVPSPPPPGERDTKKKGFAAAAFRGLGCSSASASQAYAPAVAAVRSSAGWQGEQRRRSRARRPKQKRRMEGGGGGSSSSAVAAAAAAADIWCSPGISLGADDPVDCVVARHPAAGHGSADPERARRERSNVPRHGNDRDFSTSFAGSTAILEEPLFGAERLASNRRRRGWGYRRYPGRGGGDDGLDEILMLQTRILLGRMELYDQYGGMRLDVDNMSYEELLELGDKIGHVSTGLKEEDMSRNIRKAKHSMFGSASARILSEGDRKCIICQEEYGVDDEIGNLECGHGYHLCCIKQWLRRKNTCPVCKSAVAGG